MFLATAPANIALIKYMGKTSYTENIPAHASLSWTLNHLFSTVKLIPQTQPEDTWQPIENNPHSDISPFGRQRFLKHLHYLKFQFHIREGFKVQSQNNFPAEAGLASSASSFAALTKAFAKALKCIKGQTLTSEECAHLSRKGSGSSCRSFFSGCLWKPNGQLSPIAFPQNWKHVVVLVSNTQKKISSPEAHKRVLTSPLYKGRPERAEGRLQDFMTQLQKGDWTGSYHTLKAEFWDMMGLFHTSFPSFSYLKPASIKVLDMVDQLWTENNDGPLVTMDAGPHVHLIWREDQTPLITQLHRLGLQQFSTLSSFSYNPS